MMRYAYGAALILFTVLVQGQGCQSPPPDTTLIGPDGQPSVNEFCFEYVSASGVSKPQAASDRCSQASGFPSGFDEFKSMIRPAWQSETTAYCTANPGADYVKKPAYIRFWKKSPEQPEYDTVREDDPKTKCDTTTTPPGPTPTPTPTPAPTTVEYCGKFVSASGNEHNGCSPSTTFRDYADYEASVTKTWQDTTKAFCTANPGAAYIKKAFVLVWKKSATNSYYDPRGQEDPKTKCDGTPPVSGLEYCGSYVSASGVFHTGCYGQTQDTGYSNFVSSVRNNWQSGTSTYCASHPKAPYAGTSYMYTWKKSSTRSEYDPVFESDSKTTCP